MEATKVTLEQLKDLKRELEECKLDIGGNKSTLQNRLRLALLENGEDPDTTLLELEGNISSVLKRLSIIEVKIAESSRILGEELLENSRNLEVKISDNTQSMEVKFIDEILKETDKFRKELDSLNARIEEWAGKPVAPAYAACATTLKDGSTLRLQTPTFDGETPFARNLSAFENVAEAYSWTKEEKASALKGSLRDDALDLIQNLTADEKFPDVNSFRSPFTMTNVQFLKDSSLSDENFLSFC